MAINSKLEVCAALLLQCRTCGGDYPADHFYKNGPARRKPDCRTCYEVRRSAWRSHGGSNGREKMGQPIHEREDLPTLPEYQRYGARYPERLRARRALAQRIHRGTVVRPMTCQRCGVGCTPQGHHHDYSKPLDVEWLCLPCHRVADKEVRDARREEASILTLIHPPVEGTFVR